MLFSFKCRSSVDSVISVIVKTVFVFAMEKYVGQKYSPKSNYFFASLSNDRELSLDDKAEDYVDRNTGGQVNSLHEVTQLG